MQQDKFRANGSCFGIWFLLFLVPALFVVVLVMGYMEVIPFKVGVHTLVTISSIFVIYLFFVKHNASYTACRVKNSSGQMEGDLRSALDDNSLTIMGETKSTLNVTDYLSDYFRGVRDDNYAKVASSVFPMLGILGTFIAIAISMPDFSASSSQNLDKEISLLLSGIGTAFYASIYGIFLSLWWTFFERIGLTKIEKIGHKLEDMYGEYVWSESELVKHEHMQAEIKDQKLINALRETFNLDLVKEMSEQHINNYKIIMQETTKQFEKVTEHMSEASYQLAQTVERIDSKKDILLAGEKLSEDIDKFTRGVDQLNNGFSHFNSSVDRTFSKIDNELASAVGKLGQMGEMILTQKVERSRDV